MPVIGTQQSPIKIETARAYHVSFGPEFLKFHYTRPLHGQIDGKHNFVFDPPPEEVKATDWSITVEGATWLIRQIHMHATGEHPIDADKAKPFEAHLVHSLPGDVKAKGDKLVVGVFIRPGRETREKRSLDRFAERLSQRNASSAPEPHELNPADFLPDLGLDAFYRYEGSLTGDPFTEGASWFVMKDDGVVEQVTFDALKQYEKHEARELQSLNRRFVLKSFA